MGLFDDIDEEMLKRQLELSKQPQQTTFQKEHPILTSIPEAGKQFGIRAVKSYPEFARGLNDLTALIGDTTNLQGLSNYGRRGAEF